MSLEGQLYTDKDRRTDQVAFSRAFTQSLGTHLSSTPTKAAKCGWRQERGTIHCSKGHYTHAYRMTVDDTGVIKISGPSFRKNGVK